MSHINDNDVVLCLHVLRQDGDFRKFNLYWCGVTSLLFLLGTGVTTIHTNFSCFKFNISFPFVCQKMRFWKGQGRCQSQFSIS